MSDGYNFGTENGKTEYGDAKEEVLRAMQKNERIKSDKAARRAARYKAQAEKRREKLRERAEKKERRAFERAEREKAKRERGGGNGGWIAAVISLSAATVIFAAAFMVTLFMPAESDAVLETAYKRAFYDTVEQVDNMDLNLSKTIATKDGGALQLYLTDLAVNSELAENNIQQLPLADENKFYTAKIINQVGDYAKYLNKKIARGENFSAEDYENLKNLYKANAALKNALQSAMRGMNGDYAFSEMNEKFDGNVLLDNFGKLQELSVGYPELIYDGPFSDGRDGATAEGLSGAEITSAQAVNIFTEIFAEYSPENVRFSGKNSGGIETFAVQAEVKGETLYANISVKGGKLISFSYAGSCNGVNYEQYYAVEKASAFLNELGAEDMKPVWVNLNNDLYTINFAPEQSGAIIYPDLIKVRVCAETCMIIGIEATEYYLNHTERDIGAPTLTKSEARKSVADGIAVETARLALIPLGESTERLCYEFSGEMDGETYYVYIDAENGRQLEMFKVIDSDEGSLLM